MDQSELTELRAQLRLTMELHETQAEELKASNEEQQAVNEELRSAAHVARRGHGVTIRSNRDQ